MSAPGGVPLDQHVSQELGRANGRIVSLAEVVQRQAQQIDRLRGAIELVGERFYPKTEFAQKIAGIVTLVKRGEKFNPYDELGKKDASFLCDCMRDVGLERLGRLWVMHPKWGKRAFTGEGRFSVDLNLKLQAILRFVEDYPEDFERV